MQLETAQLLMFLQWMDSAFPTGAFAHSGGLETYAQNEVISTPDDLARLIALKLESASRTDLIIVHHAMTAYVEGDRRQITELDELCSASKLVRETRQASEKIGRRMLGSILNLIDNDLLRSYQHDIATGRCAGHHAVVHGLGCAVLGIEPKTALSGFVYTLGANQTAAAVKLMNIGQSQAQAVLGSLHGTMVRVVEDALIRSLDDFGSFTPGLDIRSIEHEYLFRRLFIS